MLTPLERVSATFTLVQLLLLAPFHWLGTGFVPSTALLPVALATAPVAMALSAPLWRRAMTSTTPPLRRHLQTWLATVALSGAGWLWFMAGPVSWALHRQAPAQVTLTQLAVVRADDVGGRNCPHRFVLAGSQVFWPREVCSTNPGPWRALARGGALELVASQSAFGLQVSEHTPLTLPTRSPTLTDRPPETP